jgi:hypothetical protein
MIKRWVWWTALPAVVLAQSPDPGEFFEVRVRPVLVRNCHACHTNSKMGGLEMVSRENLLKGGNSGPAIVAGDPDNSLLIQAVRKTHARLKMPPQGELKAEEIAGHLRRSGMRHG